MANIIIGIHGLGNKPPKPLLEHWWKLAMIEGLSAINFNSAFPRFELVYWADILHDKPLDASEKNLNNPYYLDEKYVKASKDFVTENHDTRRKVVDFLNRQLNRIFLNEDLSLNYSFITDSIVSKYFKDLEIYYKENCSEGNVSLCMAKDLIRERLLKKLEKHKNDEIMLLSHSMGSIIAFDVLTFLAPEIRINTFITIGSPLGLPVVISKIASEQKHMHNNVNHMTTPPGIIKKWNNFSDILDKVAFNYQLSDNFSGNNFGVKPIDSLVVNNYETNGIRNPHKSFGYLRTHGFSKVLKEFILTEKLSLKEKAIRNTVRIFNNMKTHISIRRERMKARRSSSETR